jgi:hypothetical protein
MGKGDAVSDAGDILTALTADVQAAVSGVTVGTDPINFDQLAAVDLPYCVLVVAEYTAEHLDWGQEQRTWAVVGVLAQGGGTREQMQTKLEAIRDQVFADPTLGSAVDRATCAPLDTESNADDTRVFGVFSVEAEKAA